MSNLVIVALPSEDDYVNKISSEQVAHMTILFLGDVSKVLNLDKIKFLVEYLGNQMLTNFTLNVDNRGPLGPDEADVVFFRQDEFCFSQINRFRANLLQDKNIRTVFDSISQFDGWKPHLTLGYPDTPANSDDRDYPGIYKVNFDRIAVWDQDYSGIEFPLSQNNDYMEMGERVIGEILEHQSAVQQILKYSGSKKVSELI